MVVAAVEKARKVHLDGSSAQRGRLTFDLTPSYSDATLCEIAHSSEKGDGTFIRPFFLLLH